MSEVFTFLVIGFIFGFAYGALFILTLPGR